MASVAGLQGIAPVPTSAEFIDAVLNATMRKTPTGESRPLSRVELL